jgi:hypothetical protein
MVGGGRGGRSAAVVCRGRDRLRRAASYSMARLFRPSGVPRKSHLRSRSRTMRTASRQMAQQKRAGNRSEVTGGW